jgi:hypothetical protein
MQGSAGVWVGLGWRRLLVRNSGGYSAFGQVSTLEKFVQRSEAK